MAAKIIIIKDTPAFHVLVDAFKYASDKKNPHLLELTSVDSKKIILRVTYLNYDEDQDELVMFGGRPTNAELVGIFVSGYYNLHKQECWIEIHLPDRYY